MIPIDPYHGVATMLQFDFMRYAFLAGTSMALSAGAIGYFVVLRNLAFAGDALSHVAFAGALAAVVIGIDPLIGLLVGTIAIALLMGLLSNDTEFSDVGTGTVLAWVLGLGVLFLHLFSTQGSTTNSDIGVNVLFGSILGLQLWQAQLTAAVGLGALVVLILIGRPLLFASIDPSVALARGVSVRLLGVVFFVLVAVTVSQAVQAVGALMVFTLLVTPGAIAQRLTRRPYRAMVLSALLALAFTWTGLTVGFYASYPISFVIATAAFGCYLLTVLVRASLTVWARRMRTIRTSAQSLEG